MQKKVFNSSESYDVIDTGVRCLDFDLEPNQTAHIIMTSHPHHKPVFTVYRDAGKICAKNCQEKANAPIVGKHATISRDNHMEVVSTPGHYYLHSPIAPWMSDPCNALVIEVFIG